METAPVLPHPSPNTTDLSEAPHVARSLDLRGRKLLIVFNPAARDGRIREELSQLRQVFEVNGAEVTVVETVKNEAERRELIRKAIQDQLAAHQSINILPYGGDGTIFEVAREALRAAGLSLEYGKNSPDSVANFQQRIRLLLAKKGTASDNAAQVKASQYPWAMPAYLADSVDLPFRFPVVEVAERPGQFEVAGHDFGAGVSGFLFGLRAKNRLFNPGSLLNQGLGSYLRLIPNIVVSHYGLFGFDAEMTHYDASGNRLKSETLRVSEVITTPNRIIAGVAGVPGAWGEVKVAALPPGAHGVAVLMEFIYRGLATKLGFNLVHPRSKLWMLSEKRQWVVKPGERVETRFCVPKSWGWNVFRWLQNQQIMPARWKSEPPPSAGKEVLIPAQRNGDVQQPTRGFTVYNPDIPFSMWTAPDALAVTLARASALSDGEMPPVSDQQMTSLLSDSMGKILKLDSEGVLVRTPFISQQRLFSMLEKSYLPIDQGLAFLLESHGVTGFQNLESAISLGMQEKEFENSIPQEKTGQLLMIRTELGALGKRGLTQGIPLGAGILSMWGGELLLEQFGINQNHDRALHFSGMVFASHAVQSNVTPLWEVISNRLLKRPYDFVQMREARVAGEIFQQYTLARYQSLGEALSRSWSSAVGFTSVKTTLARSLGRGLSLPIRAAWNMGEGLVFSRIAEVFTREMPTDSLIRRYASMAGFFTPDILRIVAPRVAQALSQARIIRFASRLSAVGYIADLGFLGAHRLFHGHRATYELSLDERVSNLRRSRGEIPWWSGRRLVRFLAPSLGTYIDSHEYLFGDEIRLRRELADEDKKFAERLRDDFGMTLAHLALVLRKDPESLCRQPLRLTASERMMRDQLRRYQQGPQLRNSGFKATAAYLLQQYGGILSDLPQAERALARIQLYDLKLSLQSAQSMDIGENNWVSAFFNEEGTLRQDRVNAFRNWWERFLARGDKPTAKDAYVFAF